MPSEEAYDIVVIGAGVLGASLAHILSIKSKASVAVIEKENQPGEHTSNRNTGVIHRPFYLNPVKKAMFARAAQESFPMWKSIADSFNLPWNPVGTLEVATTEEDTRTIDDYEKWAVQNGMGENEFTILNEEDLKEYEENVRGYGAILSKTDISVSFGIFTKKVMELAQSGGIKFLGGYTIREIEETSEGASISGNLGGKDKRITARFVINASGGDSLKLAHKMGLAKNYAVLHFRGDYWVVKNSYSTGIRHNIYTVPRHKKFPFLDPHFVIRFDGSREIGPTAALVSSPYDYTDNPDSHSLILKLLERPTIPKLKLLTNSEFISLVRTEWRSSRSKNAMAERVRRFLPSLDDQFLDGHGLSGVRNSLIDSNGFVPEAVIEKSSSSYHILNFNSPGATGAPAYAWHVLRMAEKDGLVSFDAEVDKGTLWEDMLV